MNHDLAFVAPERRDEVRRRITAIERFLAHPGRVAAEECAAELGLRHAQFYNLVRAWRETHSPQMLMGLNRSRNRRPEIDRQVLDLIDEVIALDCRASAGYIILSVTDEAERRGITLPDASTVAKYVRRKRPLLLTHEHRNDFDIIVDHTVVDLPVDFGSDGVRRPLVTIALDASIDAVVGLALSSATPNPATSAEALLDAFRRGTRHGDNGLDQPSAGIVTMSTSEADGLIEELRQAGFKATYLMAHAHGGGLIVESLLGREHAGLHLKQRLVWHEGHRRSATVAPGARALTPSEAESLIRARLLSNRPTKVFGGFEDVARNRLAGQLTALAHFG